MVVWGFLLAAAAILLLALVLGRTVAFRSRRYAVEPQRVGQVNVGRAAERLAGAIRTPTIYFPMPTEAQRAPFEQFIHYLELSYPAVHSVLEWERVNTYSLLYRWKGRGVGLKPVLFSAHIDVVPVEAGTEQDWLYPPFGGDVADGFVWGRGTLDVKNQVICLLEAVDHLLAQNFTPTRDFYFAFGHDEEVRGMEGAAHLSALLQSRGVTFEYVLDEGGAVTEGVVAGVGCPVAAVGIGEKGYADIRLSAAGEAGHASMPPKHTAAGMIGRAVAHLEERQRPSRISVYLKELLAHIGPEMSLGKRIILANLWLFGPLFKRTFASSKTGNALLRTTTAVTILEAGSRPNVLPQKAAAVANFRIAPGESVQDLLAHVRRVVGDGITVEPFATSEPSKVAPVDCLGFKAIERAIYAVFPQAVTAPYMGLTATDAVKYEPLCDHIYRFTPVHLQASDLDRIHGTNERISVENVERGVRFFIELFTQ